LNFGRDKNQRGENSGVQLSLLESNRSVALPENPISGKLLPATRIASRNRSDRAENIWEKYSRRFGTDVPATGAVVLRKDAGAARRPV